MGKIFSPPKMPATPTIIYETPNAKSSDSDGTNTTDNAEPEMSADDMRVQDILNRKRGRLGTIGTSFRGVLDTNTLTPVRKTLLGE